MFSGKDLRRLIIPLVIEQILVIGVGMVDTMMISQVGEEAISGVSLVDMINGLLIGIFAALSTGGAVIVAQYLGRKEGDTACRATGQLVTMSAVFSLAIAAVCLAVQRPLLGLLFGKIDEQVMEHALVYFRISAYSYPFLALYNSCAAVFRSMGNSKVSMIVSGGMNVVNAAMNALFIFGLGMGVHGAAYASLIARAAAAVIMLFLLSADGRVVRLRASSVFALDLPLLRKIVFIALPSGIENGIFQLGRVLVVSIISGFGTVQIAANAVANNLDAMGCIAGQAMNLAMITVIGQCLGRRDTEQATYYAKKLMRIAYAATIGSNLLIFANLPWILNVYDLSPETQLLTLILVLIHNGFAMLLWPCSFTLPNCLRAGGDVRFTMTISVCSMVVFRILLSIALGIGLGLGAIGVWIAMVVDWICRTICFVARFRAGKWKTIRVI